jgi:exosortase B
MQSVQAIEDDDGGALRVWLPLLVGLSILYVPAYLDLQRTFWQDEQAAHGPLILLMTGWLIWRERAALSVFDHRGSRALGTTLLVVGLLFYVLGRSQGLHQLDVGSQIPVLLGVVYLMLGTAGVRRLWFPILMLAFLIPVPGSMLDQLLLPLKEWVSSLVDMTLHAAGYPIARNGVVLIIGTYSLLIADACSGLNSMVALSGIGMLYVYVAGHRNRALNAVLLLSILPIAFLSNVIRVMTLVLVTYYGGEGAGQEFHDHAGYLEIVLAFGGFFAVDRLMLWIDAQRMRPKHEPASASAAR